MREVTICSSKNLVHIIGYTLCLFVIGLGVAIAGTSAYVLVMYEYIGEVFGRQIFYGGLYVILACGIFIVITGFMGFCGFASGNRFTSILTVVALFCLFTAVPIIGILLFLYPRTMKSYIQDTMIKTLPEYGQNKLITKAWDTMQGYLRCCAIQNLGWHVYNQTAWFILTNTDPYDGSTIIPVTNPFYLSVPASCCATLIDGITGYSTNVYRNQGRCQNWQYGPPLYTQGPHNDALYYRGCYSVLIDYMQLHTKHLFGLSLGGSALMMLTFALLVVSKLAETPKNLWKYA